MTTSPESNNLDNPVLRVTQLDTSELDEALLINIHQSLNRDYFKYVQFNFLQKYHNQIFTGVKLIIWYNTYYKHGQTVGQSIFDWNYQNQHTKLKQCIHMIVYCFDEWIVEVMPRLFKYIFRSLLRLKNSFWRRANTNTGVQENEESHFDWVFLTIDKTFDAVNASFKLLTYLNYLIFLFDGKYLSFWERIFAMRPIYKKQQYMRHFDQKLFERELLWQSYFSLFKLIDGIFNFKRLQLKLKRKFHILKLNQTKKNSNKKVDINICGLCETQPPIMAHRAVNFTKDDGCKHVYCYICIKRTLKENDNNYLCQVCDKYVNDVEMFYDNQNF
jgi:peroxin-2